MNFRCWRSFYVTPARFSWMAEKQQASWRGKEETHEEYKELEGLYAFDMALKSLDIWSKLIFIIFVFLKFHSHCKRIRECGFLLIFSSWLYIFIFNRLTEFFVWVCPTKKFAHFFASLTLSSLYHTTGHIFFAGFPPATGEMNWFTCFSPKNVDEASM